MEKIKISLIVYPKKYIAHSAKKNYNCIDSRWIAFEKAGSGGIIMSEIYRGDAAVPAQPSN